MTSELTHGKEPHRWRPKPGTITWTSLAALVVIGLIAGFNLFGRYQAAAEIARETENRALLTVAVIHPEVEPDHMDLTLPGQTQALSEAGIFARTNGYIHSWTKDIGAKVTKGQVLAELDTPEIDEQLRQAEADLASNEVNAALAVATADRWKALLASGTVSHQVTDEKVADARAKQAQVASARANVERLRQLQKFKLITAPFDGVITERRVDIGSLINSGSGVGGELFRVADTSKLRIFTQVPQTSAGLIAVGLTAELRATDRPGRLFQAKVVRTAEAIDPTARTLLVELQTDNGDGSLFAGAYVEVKFSLPVKERKVIVPVNALLFRPEGPVVALVGADGKVHLSPVQIGLDFGNRVELISGVQLTDLVIINPPDSIMEGRAVRYGQNGTPKA